MTNVKNPLFSLSAAGSISDSLVYQDSPSGPRVRVRTKKKYTLTPERQAVSERFMRALDSWNSLSDDEKEVWKSAARLLKNTAFGLYLKNFDFDLFTSKFGKAKFGFAKFGL